VEADGPCDGKPWCDVVAVAVVVVDVELEKSS
jgi:hypothetical protein